MFSLMGKCFSCMKRKTQPKREVTLAILGIDDAGKTTTVKALLGEPLDTAPTIGFISEHVDLDQYEVKIYDLGGGSKIRGIWKQYLVELYGVIYVVDSSAPERLNETKTALKELLEHDKVKGKPLLLLANKQDHSNAMDEVDICEQLKLEDMVNANKCPCRIETCSAIKGTGRKIDQNIKVGLKWICATIEHNWSVYQPRVEEDMRVDAERKQKEMLEKRERVRKIREERERKEEEERQRLGIEKPPSDDEDAFEGDPFKRVNIEELKDKEKRLKEEKMRRKKMELEMQQDKNENRLEDNANDHSDGEIRSSRSLKYLGLQNGLGNNDNILFNRNLNSENRLHNDSDQESDIELPTGKKYRRATPRLPPLQKPLGTKFSSEEQPTGKKKKKKKKLRVLQEASEEQHNDEDITLPSKHSLQSVSAINVKTRDESPDSTDQNNYVNHYLNYPNKHIVIGKTLSVDNETEEDLTPRSQKKKKKKVKAKGTHQSFDDFPTPRTLEASDNADFASSLSYQVNDEEGATQVRRLKKKAYVKKNQTAPSDDEIEMNETLRDSNIKDFSWTLSTPKKILSSDDDTVGRNWGFAEDLGDTLPEMPTRKIGVRPNYEDDDDVLL